MIMNVGTRWVRMLAPRRVALLASRLRGHEACSQPAHKADLQQWENEGGNVAPSSASIARDDIVTTGGA